MELFYTMSDILSKCKEYKSLKIDKNKKINIDILRSYTCEFLEKSLFVEGVESNFNIQTQFGDFNQYFQEVLDNNSWFYKNNSDVILLTVNIEDYYPNLIKESLQNELTDKIISNIVKTFSNLIGELVENTKSIVMFTSFSMLFLVPNFNYNKHSMHGLEKIISNINRELINAFATDSRVFFLDTNDIIAKVGYFNYYDLKMLSYAKNPYTTNYYTLLSRQIISILNIIHKPKKKCIIVDLDNTLWGGIVGEDGYEKVKLDFYYKKIQEILLLYKETGILLAINSKNNFEDVEELFTKNNEMILKFDDFAVKKKLEPKIC
ncbi:MAG: HAD-IIIC family phosphatase [Lachnospirales bacterium]